MSVDTAIVEVILPQTYQLIADLLKVKDVPKELQIRAFKLVPEKYGMPNPFKK